MQVDPLHAARLAQLEGAMCALLREASAQDAPNDLPDSITAELKADGLDVTYWRGGVPVAGEGI